MTENKMTLFASEKDCPHNAGFRLKTFTCADRLPAFYCECLCGFNMNFSPDIAGAHRDGDLSVIPVGHEFWRAEVVSYRKREEGKVIILLGSKW